MNEVFVEHPSGHRLSVKYVEGKFVVEHQLKRDNAPLWNALLSGMEAAIIAAADFVDISDPLLFGSFLCATLDNVTAAYNGLKHFECSNTPTSLPVRTTDPATSVKAAREIKVKAGGIRWNVLRLLRHEKLTHARIIELYRSLLNERVAESTVRTRCSELEQAGYVRFAGVDTQKRQSIWQITERGEALLASEKE